VHSSSQIQFRGYLIKGCVPKIISLITSRDTNKQRAANMVLKPYQVSSWEDICFTNLYCDLNLSYIFSPLAQILSPRCLAKLNIFQQSSWSPATCQLICSYIHKNCVLKYKYKFIYIYISWWTFKSINNKSINILRTGKNSFWESMELWKKGWRQKFIQQQSHMLLLWRNELPACKYKEQTSRSWVHGKTKQQIENDLNEWKHKACTNISV